MLFSEGWMQRFVKKLACVAVTLILQAPGIAVGLETALQEQLNGSAASHGSVRTRQARLQKPIELDYPQIARRAGLEGYVVVEVLIDAQGTPQRTIVRSRSPRFVDLFDAPARAAVMRARFDPALDSEGKPVATSVRQPIAFKLHGFEGDHSATCDVDSAPHYPAEARELGAEALVGVLVKVDQTGWLDSASMTVIGREPANASMFDRAAKAAVSQARCRAARHMGRSVESFVVLEVPFKVKVSDAPVP
jgi:TonB family protein